MFCSVSRPEFDGLALLECCPASVVHLKLHIKLHHRICKPSNSPKSLKSENYYRILAAV